MKCSVAPKSRLKKAEGRIGWVFIAPALVLIVLFSIYPICQAFLNSLKSGTALNLQFAGLKNYLRLFRDPTLKIVLKNSFVFFLVSVPITLLIALCLASLLNNPRLKCKAFFRTSIFLPCAVSLTATSIIYKYLFSNTGYINQFLLKLGVIEQSIQWLTTPSLATMVIIIALIWRWPGYYMIYYLAGMQQIDSSVYEAATIDGATKTQQFFKITIPLLKPIILVTSILATNNAIKIFDESMLITSGGPGYSTTTISYYIYRMAFDASPNIGYTSAVSILVLVMIALLSSIQTKVGDKR